MLITLVGIMYAILDKDLDVFQHSHSAPVHAGVLFVKLFYR
jgi:hypothetical protein